MLNYVNEYLLLKVLYHPLLLVLSLSIGLVDSDTDN